MPNAFNEEYRFGSASWASESELRAAGLFDSIGPQIGFSKGRPTYVAGDAPLITIGGAGSGKTRDLLGYFVCASPGQRAAILDPRGELAAISHHIHAVYGDYMYCWNPVGLCGLPHSNCNVLDILRLDSRTLSPDVAFIVEGLIPTSGSSNGRYFEQRAQSWTGEILKSRVEINGQTSLPDLYRTINSIEGDRQAWADQLEAMLSSRFESVRRTAAEMLVKQQDAPKEFGGIIGEIYAQLSFLDDPVILSALEASDFSLEALADPRQPAKVFLNIPAKYLSIWSPLIRLFFTVTMLYKSRAPDAPRITLLIDEAGQLGRFEALLSAFTFGRGEGIRAWAVFQDTGQIVRNFGAPALRSFIGSAQTRQFFGVRDDETAQLVSTMLGSETLEFDDALQQEAARKHKYDTVRAVLEGRDPFEAAREFTHFSFNASHRTKQARALMSPDEILAMPEDRQIVFVSGKNLKPLYLEKHPYFSRREMAGRYIGNPYHPPTDHVRIVGRFGSRAVPVVTEAVPRKFAAFPQYASGEWSYLKGFKLS